MAVQDSGNRGKGRERVIDRLSPLNSEGKMLIETKPRLGYSLKNK